MSGEKTEINLRLNAIPACPVSSPAANDTKNTISTDTYVKCIWSEKWTRWL